MPRKKDQKPLSLKPKQRKVIRDVANGVSVYDAARAAGYSETSAQRGLAGVITTPEKRERVREIFQRHCPAEKIAKVLAEGLESTRVSRATHEGRFIDERVDIDFETRRRYAESAAKLTGYYQPEEDKPVNVQVNLAVDARTFLLRKAEEISRKMEGTA